MGADLADAPAEPGRARPSGVERGIPRWELEARLFVPAKRGAAVGLTKRGKGSKLMVVADGNGLPIGLTLASARPYEVKLAISTLETVRVPRRRGRPRRRPRELVADMAYDSREFRQWLRGKGIKPTIPVNPRGRKRKRPGRSRWGRTMPSGRRWSGSSAGWATSGVCWSVKITNPHLSCFRSRSVHRHLPATILKGVLTSFPNPHKTSDNE